MLKQISVLLAALSPLAIPTLFGADCGLPQPFSAKGGKPSLASVELRQPLTRELAENLSPAGLQGCSQEQLDQLYAKLKSGPIPNGPFRGTVIFAPGGGIVQTVERMRDVTANNQAVSTLTQFAGSFEQLKALAEGIWAGKIFYKKDQILMNMINEKALTLLGIRQADAGRTHTIDGKTYWERFPAKLYCGQSLMDSRRESVIIDYAFADDVTELYKSVDDITTRKGTMVRDEIRMVRPGFYLGRAYMQRQFVLNFTLFATETPDSEAKNECWAGTQYVGR